MDANALASDSSNPVANDTQLRDQILDYYRLAGPLIEATFGGEPIVYANFPQGFGEKPHFVVTDVPLSKQNMLYSSAERTPSSFRAGRRSRPTKTASASRASS